MNVQLLAAEIVTRVRTGIEAGESPTNLATLVEGLLERDVRAEVPIKFMPAPPIDPEVQKLLTNPYHL